MNRQLCKLYFLNRCNIFVSVIVIEIRSIAKCLNKFGTFLLSQTAQLLVTAGYFRMVESEITLQKTCGWIFLKNIYRPVSEMNSFGPRKKSINHSGILFVSPYLKFDCKQLL